MAYILVPVHDLLEAVFVDRKTMTNSGNGKKGEGICIFQMEVE